MAACSITSWGWRFFSKCCLLYCWKLKKYVLCFYSLTANWNLHWCFFTVHWVKLFCVDVSVRQTAERYVYSRPLPIVRHYHRDYSAERIRLLRLQQSKTVVTLVCLGAVASLYYSSLDRQSRRKFQATADGVARFLRYRCWDLLLASFDFNQLCLQWLSSWQTFIRANGLCYT